MKTLKVTLFKLIELVELCIKEELKNNIPGGMLMHHGWTRNGTHFIAFFASYCHEITHTEKGVVKKMEKPELTLLACSPMAQVQDDTDLEDAAEDIETETISESTKCNAETHVEFFKDSLRWYTLCLKWIKCILANNTSTNQKITKMIGVPHIGCHNHLLNLEVIQMFKEDVSLKQTSSATHQVMLEAKQSLKNHSIVWSLTYLSPIVSNETCWSGKLSELTQMKCMRAVCSTDLCIFN
jgi:hypothetical protein